MMGGESCQRSPLPALFVDQHVKHPFPQYPAGAQSHVGRWGEFFGIDITCKTGILYTYNYSNSLTLIYHMKDTHVEPVAAGKYFEQPRLPGEEVERLKDRCETISMEAATEEEAIAKIQEELHLPLPPIVKFRENSRGKWIMGNAMGADGQVFDFTRGK